MRKVLRLIVGMTVCLLGVIATSSCSKDEFFGLEDSEVIDASTKYEIAMSQEYANYAIACFELSKAMNQPVDTSMMQYAGDFNGKAVYVKEGPSSAAMELLDVLKKKYPEFNLADKMDFDEITKLALANNEALKDIASINCPDSKGARVDIGDCGYWAQSVGGRYGSFGSHGWEFYCNSQGTFAVADAIYYSTEWYNSERWSAGLGFADGSAVSMNGPLYDCWPQIINSGSPRPEYDFIIIPYFAGPVSYGDLIGAAGEQYILGNRLHYIYSFEYTLGASPLDYYNYTWYAFYIED